VWFLFPLCCLDNGILSVRTQQIVRAWPTIPGDLKIFFIHLFLPSFEAPLKTATSLCQDGFISLKCGEGRDELSYLAPLGNENISAPYFKQRFFRGGVLPPRQSNTTPPSPRTEITNILFYILNFASIITFKM